MAEVFARALYLESLAIHTDQTTLDEFPELGISVSSLKSLTSLSFEGRHFNQGLAGIISRMKSPLVSLVVEFDDDVNPPDLCRIVAPFSSTLEYANLKVVSLCDAEVVPCTRLSTLIITISAASFTAGTLIRLFPNLEDLDLHLQLAQSDDVDAIRRRNKLSQRDCGWKSMDILSCDSETKLYAAGFSCHVNQVLLTKVVEDVTHLAAIVADMTPRVLALKMWMIDFDARVVNRLLREDRNLTELILKLTFMEDMYDEWAEFVDCWLEILDGCTVTRLELELRRVGLSQALPLMEPEATETFADLIAERVPLLRSLTIKMSTNCQYHWRIHRRRNGTRSLERRAWYT
ncbi:hypothetical protein OBBRIDRAFT_836620 [Obba rivulosa]|uniref:Uncharacterized protein n=1 Tax=Obba rivulosa TaxID=1052685 RepID=A0A8E2DMT8_9APHY|nr:hypothetical protein OBBRIDRAFT_836620 [Obba rivulosa]